MTKEAQKIRTFVDEYFNTRFDNDLYVVKFSKDKYKCCIFMSKKDKEDFEIYEDELVERCRKVTCVIDVDIVYIYENVLKAMINEEYDQSVYVRQAIYKVGDVFLEDKDEVIHTKRLLIIDKNKYSLLVDEDFEETVTPEISEKFDRVVHDIQLETEIEAKLYFVPEAVIHYLKNHREDWYIRI